MKTFRVTTHKNLKRVTLCLKDILKLYLICDVEFLRVEKNISDAEEMFQLDPSFYRSTGSPSTFGLRHLTSKPLRVKDQENILTSQVPVFEKDRSSCLWKEHVSIQTGRSFYMKIHTVMEIWKS